MTTHGVLRQRQESNDSMQNPTARKRQHAHTIKAPRQQQYHGRRELNKQRHTRSRPHWALRNTRHDTRNKEAKCKKSASKKRRNQWKMCNGKWRKEKWRRTMTTPKQKNFWKGKGTNENERKMTNAKWRRKMTKWEKKKMPTNHRRGAPAKQQECHDGGSMKIIIMNSTRLWNCTMSRWGEHENTSRINAVTIDTGTQRLILLGGA